MRRKNQLYTANQWNQPLFAPNENLFELGGMSQESFNRWDALASKEYGAKYGDNGYDSSDYMNSKNAFGISKKNNPFSKGNIKQTAGGIATAVAPVVGALGNSLISNGLESAAGSTISSLGSTIGGAVGAVNPIAGAAISVGSQLVGGLVNRAWGMKTDQAALNAANAGTSAYNNFQSNASNFDAIQGPQAQANVQNAYKGGWFSSDKARRKNAALKQARLDARQLAFKNVENNVNNLVGDQMNDALANYAAFGGPLDMINNDNMGAIGYGFMSDYLTMKDRQNQTKDTIGNIFAGTPSAIYADGGSIEIKHPGRLTELKKRTGKTEAELWAEGRPEVRKMITFARNARKWNKAYGGYLNAAQNLFDIGGDLQANGADWTTGMTHINAGGSHEDNPYDGVQVGVDNQGIPNLVEEGETIFNDYVYSTRIMADEQTKKRFHLPKKKDISYADISKRLEREAAERPNDPISQAALKRQMELLANEQERQKQEMQAEQAQQAFASLSPEEQTSLMQQVEAGQQQQEMMQQQAQEQAMAQQQMAQQISPEEQAMMQQQMMAQQMGGAPQEGYAYGGNLYAPGGSLNSMTKWISTQHPELSESEKRAIAQKMVAVYNTHYKAHPAYVNLHTVYRDATSSKPTNRVQRSANGVTKGIGETAASTSASRYNNRNTTAATPAPKKEALINRNTGLITDPRVATEKIIREKNRQRELRRQRRILEDITPLQTDFTAPVWSAEGFNGQQPVDYYDYEAPAPKDVKKASTGKSVKSKQLNSGVGSSSGNGTGSYTPQSTGYSGENGGGDWIPYDWYRNGSDGYSTPAGFTVGDDGLVTEYTPEYRALVNELTANDIRRWAEEHPDDPSLKSFLSKGNKLDNLTDEQWRRGATDGKYGFMHHVAEEMLNKGGDRDTIFPNGKVHHAIIGDDEYLDDFKDLGELGPVEKEIVLQNGDKVIYHAGPTVDEGLAIDAAIQDYKGEGDVDFKTEDVVAPEAEISSSPEDAVGGKTSADERRVVPVHRNDNWRYAGLFGPAVGLGMQVLGIGKPDLSRLDAIVQRSANPTLADAKYIGDYERYTPFDRLFYANQLGASARATDRAIMNTVSPSKQAGLLANGYNSQLGLGSLYRQGEEYNDALYHRTKEFNRGTNQFNAGVYNQLSQFNADALNRNSQFKGQLAMAAEGQRLAADAAWNRGIYGNVAGLFKGIGDYGLENSRRNMVADMAASGLFGVINPDNFNSNGLFRWETDEERQKRLNGKAKGGKINRRGLTF